MVSGHNFELWGHQAASVQIFEHYLLERGGAALGARFTAETESLLVADGEAE